MHLCQSDKPTQPLLSDHFFFFLCVDSIPILYLSPINRYSSSFGIKIEFSLLKKFSSFFSFRTKKGKKILNWMWGPMKKTKLERCLVLIFFLPSGKQMHLYLLRIRYFSTSIISIFLLYLLRHWLQAYGNSGFQIPNVGFYILNPFFKVDFGWVAIKHIDYTQ